MNVFVVVYELVLSEGFLYKNIFVSVVADFNSDDRRAKWLGSSVLLRLRWKVIGRAVILKFSPSLQLILRSFALKFVSNFVYGGRAFIVLVHD